MAGATFKTNPYSLHEILQNCHRGLVQLPDFQRSWVWDEDRIKSLIASVSRAFPIGALMTLETGGDVDFKPRLIEGAPTAIKGTRPQSLLLDGQQRMTSLYQVALRGQVVETVTPRKKKVSRWFYIDINKALDPAIDRDEAIISVPEDKRITEDFGREVSLDLTQQESEFKNFMYPVSRVFDWDDWQDGFDAFWSGPEHDTLRKEFRRFKKEVLENFKSYDVPVIALGSGTSKEAVCVVFEKVNTGGKPLDAFELVTAMYAADGHELRRDWFGMDDELGRQHRLKETLRPAGKDVGILAEVSNTDFLHAISLFHTRERRREAEAAGKQGKDLPAVSGNRNAMLNLPLGAYKKYQDQVEVGFVRAAKFLHMLHIYRVFDLPYQTQVIPLAAILADLGDAWEHEANRRKLIQWYWNGVFGELYGSAVETRIARDFMEVPRWIRDGGEPPTTIRDATFRAERLKTMRMRISAAYKGVNALLMRENAQDFRSGQKFDHIVFFGENVDIHHIFPKKWCDDRKIDPSVYDSIINKTPLGYRTNRMIGGAAPSIYLEKLETGNEENPPILPTNLDQYLTSHLISPTLLRADDFNAFMEDRQTRLLKLIEQATGQSAYRGDSAEVDDETDEEVAEAKLTMAPS
jgi:hypothetical protein